MQSVIKVENLGKLYRLGEVGTGTVSHDLNRWIARVRGKEDPFAKIGEVNDRTTKGVSDYVWAIQDITYNVGQGEVLGIIGRNGAGKSTLLKILSKVTTPTTGNIKIKGRIASLLEVGTGFHPELTGRENIFLNGAILGMRKKEIRRKFDEIVEFAGVERYIDTPVKRYSSGMYVRLAFAVAAHLESEILIVDEVLAVGDAEFQKKCLGRMKDVSVSEGRTVLFVSHNMAAVKNLCGKCILLNNGRISEQGSTTYVLEKYFSNNSYETRLLEWKESERPKFPELEIISIRIEDGKGSCESQLSTTDPLFIRLKYLIKTPLKNLRVAISLFTTDDIEIFSTSDYDFVNETRVRDEGVYTSVCEIPGDFLNMGEYILKAHFDLPGVKNFMIDIPVQFTVSEVFNNQLGPLVAAKPGGVIHPRFHWQVDRKQLRLDVPSYL